MAIFESKTVVEKMFGEIWQTMINETEFGPKIKEGNISIYFLIENPDVTMFVDENGPVFGKEAATKVPMITMKMRIIAKQSLCIVEATILN